MTAANEINEIIIRQLKKHKLGYDCYFDPEMNGEIVGAVRFDDLPKFLDERCIFSDCSDSELILLFNAVIDRLPLDWDIIQEICQMLPAKGDLTSSKLEKIIFDSEFDHSNHQLLFAYLGSGIKYEAKIIELLDTVPEDFRDGVFIACDRLNTPAITRKLFEKFKNGSKSAASMERAPGKMVSWNDLSQSGNRHFRLRICSRDFWNLKVLLKKTGQDELALYR